MNYKLFILGLTSFPAFAQAQCKELIPYTLHLPALYSCTGSVIGDREEGPEQSLAEARKQASTYLSSPSCKELTYEQRSRFHTFCPGQCDLNITRLYISCDSPKPVNAE